jgi:adhesin/invasin
LRSEFFTFALIIQYFLIIFLEDIPMVRAFLMKVLMLFFAALLAGCGGGGAFTATTGTGTTGGTGGTTSNAATLTMRGQTVIPIGKKSTTLTFTFRNENGTPITNGTLTFTVSGLARIGGKSSGSMNTDSNGDVSVVIENDASEMVTLSVTPTAPNRTFTPTHLDYPLYFSPVINAFISPNNQPANGTAASKLTVRIQDQKGNPFVGVPTALAFSPKSFAVAANVPTQTDSNGIFAVDITDTIAETLVVYPSLGGYVLEGLPVIFSASTQTVPTTVSLTVNSSPVLADGIATADLLIIARDTSGTPIADVEVVLSLDSGSAVLGSARGKTGSNGVFKTTISNTIEQEVYVFASVSGVQAKPQKIVFSKAVSSSGNAIISMEGQTVIPMGQNSAKLIFTFLNENSTPITNGSLTFTVSGSARIAGKSSGSVNTDENGKATVVIENNVSESVTLAVTPTAPNRTFTPTHLDTTLYFSPTINAFISNDGQPANGTAAAKLTVRIQDQQGKPFAGVPTALAFSPKSFATTVNLPTQTDSNGLFTVDITNTVAESLSVYPTLGGYTLNGLPLTFTASSLTTPSLVTITASDKTVLADGVATTNLTVIARDASGTPIANAEVTLSSSSGSAVLGAAAGKTGTNGAFQTTLKNTVVEPVTITPSVGNVRGASLTVNFTNSTSTSPVATVTATKNGDPRPASGTDAIVLTVFARNASGDPVIGAEVSLKVSSGSATFSPDSGKTDNLGRFITNVTDRVAENFTVTPIVGNVAGETLSLTFNAIPSSATAVPATVSVTAANNNQAADGKSPITLNVIVRDASNIPLSGVDVVLSSDSTSAVLTAASGKTNAGGVFTTTISNTKVESFLVRANAGSRVGETVVSFGTPSNVNISQITITDNNKLANGKEIITVTALVRDAQNQPAVGVPMTLAINPNTSNLAAAAIPDKASGITGSGGEFIVKLTDTVPETFTVTVGVSGTTNTRTSGNISFIESTATVQPAKLELLTSSSQLASEGKADGIVLTAILKTKENNPYKGGEVRFSSDSGTIQPIAMGTTPAGTTNDAGQAQARLTTEGNPINRDIKVIAKSGELTQELTITVDGTVLSITGQGTAIQGSSQELVILLKDSAGRGVSGKKLKVVSSLNNPLSNSNPTTDGSGAAKIALTAKNAGKDTITVSFDGIATDKIESVNHILMISNDNFTVTSLDGSSTENDVPLGSIKQFKIHWDKSGAPQLNEIINISASRGKLSTNSVMTNTSGDATFSISSDNAGPTEITVAAKIKDGPSKVIKFDFVATQSAKLDLQAEPATLGVNIGSNTSEQSTIIAVVRDANNNLVKGKRIEFNLSDVTAGEISPSFAVTDGFGRATTIYRSGSSTGANKDVIVEGKVADTPSVKATVKITIARRQAFIILGTGNKIIEKDVTKYQLPFTSLVTDVNGNPIKGAVVDFTVIPTRYMKGWWYWDDKSSPAAWVKVTTISCSNEDLNRNGIVDLDLNEDINKNGILDPRNVATLSDANGTGTGNAIKITTNENGFADFNILYPKNYSTWIDVELVARTVVAGTETEARSEFRLAAMVADLTGKDSAHPSEYSPFRIGGNKRVGEHQVVIDETLIKPNPNINGGKTDINGNDVNGIGKDTSLPPMCEFAPELEN